MSPKLKRILSFLFIVLSITAVIFIAFSNEDLTNAWDAFKKMNYWWLAGIFLCWLTYTFFDGMNYWCYLKRQGFKISIGRAVNVALIGFYYSNITPSAAGGQPMQVNSMRKAGIPVGYGTMAVTIRFITNQTMISIIALEQRVCLPTAGRCDMVCPNRMAHQLCSCAACPAGCI